MAQTLREPLNDVAQSCRDEIFIAGHTTKSSYFRSDIAVVPPINGLEKNSLRAGFYKYFVPPGLRLCVNMFPSGIRYMK